MCLWSKHLTGQMHLCVRPCACVLVFVCVCLSLLQLSCEMWSMTEGAQRVSNIAVLLHFILRAIFASGLKGRPYSPTKCLGNLSKIMFIQTLPLFWLSLPHQIQLCVELHCVKPPSSGLQDMKMLFVYLLEYQTPASHVTVISILQPTNIRSSCLFLFFAVTGFMTCISLCCPMGQAQS